MNIITVILITAALLAVVTACGLDRRLADVTPNEEAGQPPSVFQVTPFSNIAATALQNGFEIWNDRPGVVIFDYDRDGDLDFYLTSQGGHPNWLYRNNGNATFTDVAGQASVALAESNSTGAVACDINTPIPDGTGNFTFLGGPSVSGGNVLFNGRGSSGQEGIYIYTTTGGLDVVADLNTPIPPPGTGNFTAFSACGDGNRDFSLDGENVAFRAAGSSPLQQGIYAKVGGLESAV